VNNPSTRHHEFEELLGYLQGTLSSQTDETMDVHFAGCEECTMQVRSIGAISSMLERWGETDAVRQEPRPALVKILRALARGVHSADIRDRLATWAESRDGRAEGAVRLAIDRALSFSRIFTQGLDDVLRPGASWQFANDMLTATPVRGTLGANPIAVAVAPGSPRAIVAVSSEASEIEV